MSVSNLANGADQIQRRSKSTQIKHVVAKLQGLGLDVEIKPLAAWLARRYLRGRARAAAGRADCH